MIKNSKEPESIYDVISKEWKKEKEIRPKRDRYSFFKKLITELLKGTDYREKIKELGIDQFKVIYDWNKIDKTKLKYDDKKKYWLYYTGDKDNTKKGWNKIVYDLRELIVSPKFSAPFLVDKKEDLPDGVEVQYLHPDEKKGIIHPGEVISEEGLEINYRIPDEKRIAEFYVACLRYEERGIDVKELDELTDLLKAVEPCSTKESGIPYYISKWGKEVVRILLKGGRMKHQDILLELQELPNKFPVSYTHISKIFKLTRAKKFFRDEIVNDNSYYSLKNPAKFKL